MSIKVCDLMKLKSLKGLKLMAGEGGLKEYITAVSIAELEFEEGYIPDKDSFRQGTFVVTGTVGIHDNEERIIPLILRLGELKASGVLLVTKEGFVIEDKYIGVCNEINLPVFYIASRDVYAENAIYEIFSAVQESSVSFSFEKEMERIMSGTMGKNELDTILNYVNPDSLRECSVTFISGVNGEVNFSPSKVARAYANKYNSSGLSVGLIAFMEGLLVVVSMNRLVMKKRDEVVDSILAAAQVDRKDVLIAHSDEHIAKEELDTAFRESIYTFISQRVTGQREDTYGKIGKYRFIVPSSITQEAKDFMKDYISSMKTDQLETAILFVKSGCDYEETAKILKCHRNTVRYRISRIKEKMDPEKSEFEFCENLSLAIKLYLMDGKEEA